MEIRKMFRILMIVGMVLCGGTLIAQQTQVVKAQLFKNTSAMNICLIDDTDVYDVDVFDDEIVLRTLPANQSGNLEFTVVNLESAHATISLAAVSNPAINYSLEFNNGILTINGTNSGSYSDLDIFRIERCGGEFNFYQNDVLLAPSPVDGNNFDLVFNAVVEVIAASTGSELSMTFPNLLPHCVPSNQTPGDEFNFLALKKELDGTYARVANGNLKFWYDERYAIANGVNNAVEYSVYDWEKM